MSTANYKMKHIMGVNIDAESMSGMASDNSSIKEIKVYKMKPEEM